MSRINCKRIGAAFDMAGCPNRCRHCWLGKGSNLALSEQDVRWGVSQFRDFIAEGNSPVRNLSVSTYFREPDYRDDYRHLYDLEAELGDGKPERFELLSIWRLARDENYASWAKSVGPDTCQITFFGMRETNDWFYRRRGAFADALTATERLLDAGMKPRWQLFLTTKLLPELDDLLVLADKLNLVKRVRELGSEFQIFLTLPGPDGEAVKIEHLRPTADQVSDLPEDILASSRKHLEKETLWRTEAELVSEIISAPEEKEELPEKLWFFVCGNWDVYANIGTLEPWWCLGNLKRDSVESIIRRYELDKVSGLKALFHQSPANLAGKYGNPDGQRIYSCRDSLLCRYREAHCKSEWRGNDG